MPRAQQVPLLRASCLRLHLREPRAHYIRHASSQSDKPEPARGRSNGPKGSKRNAIASKLPAEGPSLLEELFPEEAKKMQQATAQKKERDIPRLDLRSTIPDEKPLPIRDVKIGDTKAFVAKNWWNTMKKPATLGPKPAPVPARAPTNWPEQKPQVCGMLILHNASKTLVADDFIRLIPQGTHIEGWPLDQADILKVVPGRRTDTLEREDFYFILFKSRAAMNAYRKHVFQLHVLAQRNIQSSLLSPIPPPPGYHVGGEDVDARLQSYTLLAPTQHIRLIPVAENSLTPYLTAIIDNLGYPDVVKTPLQEPFIVMLRLEGPQVGIMTVKRALYKVEKLRRIPWDLDFRSLNSCIWHAKARNLSYWSRSRLEKIPTEEDGDEEEMDQRGQGAKKEKRSASKRERRQKRAAYLFGFSSEEKALTFVQYWHRRPLHLAEDMFENDELAPVVEAELLW